MSYTFEAKIEHLCDQILRADAENWDARNRAVIQITELVLEYDGLSASDISDSFTPNVYRALKEPVKILICDLRSQQVRDCCILLSHLARITGERMKLFLRDLFPAILEGIKVPNKVMSGYVDECILSMIRFTNFKSAVSSIVMEMKESKSKFVREKCMEYVNEILLNWELSEKEFDLICDALRIGLEDASPRAREVARSAFINLYKIHQRKAEKLRLDLPKTLQAKLMEEILRTGSKGESVSSIDSTSETVPTTPSTPARQKLHRTSSSRVPSSASRSLEPSNPAASMSFHSMSDLEQSKYGASKRRSLVKNPFAELSNSYSEAQNTEEFHAPSHTPRGAKSISPVKQRRTNLTVDVSNSQVNKVSAASTPDISPAKPQSTPDRQEYFDISVNKALSVGLKVIVNAGRELKATGVIRFIGETQFASGTWIGVELHEPVGKNNGSVQGVSYFHCPMQYGLFLREENVNPIIEDTYSSSQDIDSQASTSAAHDKKMKSTSVLKVKLSQMMELLNKQLEIVEELEREEKNGNGTPRSNIKCGMLREEVFKISCKEMELVENFCYRWKEYCPDS